MDSPYAYAQRQVRGIQPIGKLASIRWIGTVEELVNALPGGDRTGLSVSFQAAR